MKHGYLRLFNDDDGNSHFANVSAELRAIDFVAGAPPLFLSSTADAAKIAFFGAPANWLSDWHPSSARNLFVVLSGEWEVKASDGEVRTFSTGDVLLVEDTFGKGHQSRVISQDFSLALLIELPML